MMSLTIVLVNGTMIYAYALFPKKYGNAAMISILHTRQAESSSSLLLTAIIALLFPSISLANVHGSPASSFPHPFSWFTAVIFLASFTAIIVMVLLYHHSLTRVVAARTKELTINNQALKKELNERIAAEKKVTEGRNLYQILLDNLPQSVFLKDTSFHYVSAPTVKRCGTTAMNGFRLNYL